MAYVLRKGDDLRNKCIVLHSDNEAVVHIINRQTCKLALVHGLVLVGMKLNILFRAEHFSGILDHERIPQSVSSGNLTNH